MIMNKPALYIPVLLAIGFIIGVVIMSISDNVKDGQWTESFTRSQDVADMDVSQQVPDISPLRTDDAPAQSVGNKLAELEARVSELEQALDSQPEVENKSSPRMATDSTRFRQMSRMPTTQSLVKAGISEDIAADIVRRSNDIELRKLELQDKATREGYVNTARYSDELAALMTEQKTLREELGDDAYDQYLFANKQTNRVKAVSVMLGSAAELAGMKTGDLILTYGEYRVFDWHELKQKTSEGKLGEYVNVDILRDGQLMSLWVPRGPLGVRLGGARVEP